MPIFVYQRINETSSEREGEPWSPACISSARVFCASSKPDIGAFAISTSLLVTLSMVTHGHFAMWIILAVGFFNCVAELGPLTGNGSGILNMAIVGGAILPVVQGIIADHIGIHHAFFVPVICYL